MTAAAGASPGTGGTGTTGERRFRLIGLDPANRLAELTGGITVVLTILVGTSFIADDVDDPRDVLVGLAVVAAFAAGLSGGIMNVIESLYDDAALRRDELTITHADLTERRALVRRLLDDHIDVDIDDEAADRVVEAILDEPPEAVRVRAIDVRDVIASVVLNLFAMLPVVLVFWLIDDWHSAARSRDRPGRSAVRGRLLLRLPAAVRADRVRPGDARRRPGPGRHQHAVRLALTLPHHSRRSRNDQGTGARPPGAVAATRRGFSLINGGRSAGTRCGSHGVRTSVARAQPTGTGLRHTSSTAKESRWQAM